MVGLTGIYASGSSAAFNTEGDILWDARTAKRFFDQTGNRVTEANGTPLSTWMSTNNSNRLFTGSSTYVVDGSGRPGVRDSTASNLTTAAMPLFNRTWCIVYTVNSSNFWHWYGNYGAAAGLCLVVSNGTIRFRGNDNFQLTAAFGVPTYGTPTVFTFQFSQEGPDVVYRAMYTNLTSVASTTFANRTLIEDAATPFLVAPGTPDLTTHSLRLTAGTLLPQDLAALHAQTKADWNIA
jgi:hypothetical protein